MKLLMTRPLTAAVQARARAEFDVDIRVETTVLRRDEMIRVLRDYDLVMPTLGDAFDAGVFAEVGQPRCRLLANFGVGFNHIDVEAAKAHGVAVSNTPG
ncbi:MAG: D-glycerate dehydrogenase, partial [Pseudophaeobacter sp.]